jgi:hypothetical protein
MVTCVDVCGFHVMSASLDGTVALWDLRSSDAHQTITAVSAAGNDSVGWLVGSGGNQFAAASNSLHRALSGCAAPACYNMSLQCYACGAR